MKLRWSHVPLKVCLLILVPLFSSQWLNETSVAALMFPLEVFCEQLQDTCFFIDLNSGKVTFKPDDFPNKFTMSNANLKRSNQVACYLHATNQYLPIHTLQLHSFAGLSQLDVCANM